MMTFWDYAARVLLTGAVVVGSLGLIFLVLKTSAEPPQWNRLELIQKDLTTAVALAGGHLPHDDPMRMCYSGFLESVKDQGRRPSATYQMAAYILGTEREAAARP